MELDFNSVIQNKSKRKVKIQEINIKDIAIIGISVKLPLADSVEQFWNNLRQGVDCVRKIPEVRKQDTDCMLSALGIEKNTQEYGEAAFLEEIDKFDYSFFKLSPKEASLMDPNQRLFLETAWKTIEDAGYGGDKLIGSRTGIYVGYGSDSDYKSYITKADPDSATFSIPGNIRPIIASRLSYIMDFKGPSMLVDTTCSSSMVAVHLACNALRNMECEQAIVAGLQIHLLPVRKVSIGIESSNGRARTFDDSSDGTGTGEGVVALMLKPLSRALEDKDNIYAVIKGSAINHDGSSIGITAPNAAAQEDVIVRAWEDAGINPETISYIEAHGTGTKLGDPIELDGIRRAFGRYTDKKNFCAIGAVKTNIGHLDNTSGIVGLLKAALSLKYKQLVPTINFKRPNRNISFEDSPVYIVDKLSNWESDGNPRRCGISSFGLSGTNSHVILEEAPGMENTHKAEHDGELHLLCVSAKSRESLKRIVQNYKEYIEKNPASDAGSICYTANTGRNHYEYRVAVLFNKLQDLYDKLDAFLADEKIEEVENVYYGKHKLIASKSASKAEGELTEAEILRLNIDAEETVRKLLGAEGIEKEKYLNEICALYIKGAKVNWEAVYSRKVFNKLSLPSYPFEKKRCWIGNNESATKLSDDIYYKIDWVHQDISCENKFSGKDTFLILMDKNGIGREISIKLKNEGIEVIQVQTGEFYEKHNDGNYTISISENDFEKLFMDVKNRAITKIIHLLSVEENKPINTVNELDERQETGVYSLFYMIKAILSNNIKDCLDVVLMSENVNEVTGDEEYLNPIANSMFGLAKVVEAEYKNLQCRCIDFDNATSADALLLELKYKKEAFVTAYRRGKRYIEEFNRINLEKIKKSNIEIKDRGVYVITGGTGGIGLEIAKYLTEKNKVKLMLINRSAMPDREEWNKIDNTEAKSKILKKIKDIQEIEKSGSKVEFYNADLSDAVALKSVLEKIRAEHGKIDGIIHSAGVAGEGYIINKKKERFKNVLLPKVNGTWLLDKLTENDNLDFFVVFSSINTLAGMPGQGDYTAANSFLDSFAKYRSKLGKPTTVINWTAWDKVGMTDDFNVVNNKGIFRQIDAKTAVIAFGKVIDRCIGSVVVGELNIEGTADEKAISEIGLKLSNEIIAMAKHTNRDKNYEASRVQRKVEGRIDYFRVEKETSDIWKYVLGFEELNIYDNFFDIGGDSIMITKMHSLLNEKFPGSISVSELFTNTTIYDISNHILNYYNLNNTANEQDLSGDLKSAHHSEKEDIAIIGMALKLPGAKSSEEFWDNLCSGVDSIGKLPASRLKDCNDMLQSTFLNGKSVVYSDGGYLEEIDKFDNRFFNISPNEAAFMDPNQRLFLETAWEAIEDSGYGGKKIEGSNTGVYLGFSNSMNSTYSQFIIGEDPSIMATALSGNLQPIIASRVSYLLDLKGPSLLVDTACSSSLVALHLAKQAISNHECDMAVVGGVNISLLPVWKNVIKMGMESPDYKTKTFDDSSDGTCWSEGVAAVVLKPVSKAIKDRDNIYAVIKGSAINQDGNSVGITAPNSAAQEKVIIKAWEDAGVNPETISYIEAHGTGTKLGDPIEIDAINRAFKKYTNKKQFCAIGSVKSNIGHLNNASGIASLIKGVLALKNGRIPPIMHFKRANRHIEFENTPVYVNDRLTNWKKDAYPRRCGISSFGFSGTNCHVILEEAPQRKSTCSDKQDKFEILKLSAKNMTALMQLVSKYNRYLRNNIGLELRNICYTANTGRKDYEYRVAFLVSCIEDLMEKLNIAEVIGIAEAENKGVFYGCHKLVAQDQPIRAKNELTVEEKLEISRAASEKMLELIENGSELPQNIFENLCSLYVNGADIDWDIYYREKDVTKVSIPTYPFEQSRCWIKPKKAEEVTFTANDTIAHPLVNKNFIESINQDIYLTQLSEDRHWVLSDHKISGVCVAPGTTWLEVIRTIGERYFNAASLEMEVLFVTPVTVPSGISKEVQIVVNRESDSFSFTIVSKSEKSEEWIVHAKGKFSGSNCDSRPTFIDFEEIKSISGNVKEVREEDFLGGPIQFGPRWKNLKQVYIGENEFLGLLELQDKFADDLKMYAIHPALMDVAVNFGNTGGFYLPMAYKKLSIFGRMPKRFYSYIRKNKNKGDNLETMNFDISLMDESGNVFIEVQDYIVKRVRDGELKVDDMELKDAYHVFEWIPKRQSENKKLLNKGDIILFYDDKGFAEKTALYLRSIGKRVIEVHAGSSYEKSGHDKYIIGDGEESCKRLFEDLRGNDFAQILHFQSIDNKHYISSEADFDKSQANGILSLFYIVKSLTKINRQVDIVLIAENVNEVTGREEWLNPHQGSMFGLGKVIGSEYADLSCRAIDIDSYTTVDNIIDELREQSSIYQVAYREGIRYVEEFRSAGTDTLKMNTFELKEDGVYIITGGTGAIGLEIAKYFASKKNVNLALINRTAIAEKDVWKKTIEEREDSKLAKKYKALQEIEKMGSCVECFAADISKADDVKRILDKLRKTYGRINGIVHSAGVAGNGFIINKDRKTFDEVLLPKTKATWLLDKLTAEDEMEFLIMFSSVNSLMGVPGQGDYTAANSYLDVFSAYRNKTGRRTAVINWPAWKEIGMAVDFGVNGNEAVFKPLLTRHAIKAFEEFINMKTSRLIVGELNRDSDIISSIAEFPFKLDEKTFNMLKKWKTKAETAHQKQAETPKNIVLKGKSEGNYGEIELKVAKLWSDVLGVEELDVYDNFYSLGGDSIHATRLLQKLDEEFPKMFDIADIFAYETVNKMSKYIFSKLTDKQNENIQENKELEEISDIDKLFDQLESGEISIDEAEKRMS